MNRNNVPNVVPISTITNNLRFPGQHFDAETGLHYNYFRDYNPALGRYPEADPIGLQGGPNVYIYANDNSVNWNDARGLDANTWTYGEIGSWAIKSYKDPSAPAGLADAKASLAAVCSKGNSCNSVDGSTATNPFDKAAWKNIVNASGGTDKSGGANYFNVGTDGLFMTHCFKCSCGKKIKVQRANSIPPTGTVTVSGLNGGTLYFYSDPNQFWCPEETKKDCK